MKDRVSCLPLTIGGLVLSAIFIVLFLFACTATVDASQICVITTFGNINRVSYGGWNFKPYWDSYNCYPRNGVSYETSEFPENSGADFKDYRVESTTSDGQRVWLSYTVVAHVEPTKVQEVYVNVGRDVKEVIERVVKVESRSQTRKQLQQYAAPTLYGASGLSALEKAMEPELKEALAARDVILDTFVVREIDFTPEYSEAVEQKQIQQINIDTQRNRAQAALEEAQRIRNEEQGKADARVISAKAEAESLSLVAQQLRQNPALIQYEMVKRLNNVNWGFLPTSALPLLNIPQTSQ